MANGQYICAFYILPGLHNAAEVRVAQLFALFHMVFKIRGLHNTGGEGDGVEFLLNWCVLYITRFT